MFNVVIVYKFCISYASNNDNSELKPGMQGYAETVVQGAQSG